MYLIISNFPTEFRILLKQYYTILSLDKVFKKLFQKFVFNIS